MYVIIDSVGKTIFEKPHNSKFIDFDEYVSSASGYKVSELQFCSAIGYIVSATHIKNMINC